MQGCKLMTVSHWTTVAKNLPMSNEIATGSNHQRLHHFKQEYKIRLGQLLNIIIITSLQALCNFLTKFLFNLLNQNDDL